ncbi:response regulator [Ramlibacter sp. XY19]|uniref:response regulator transcription factor n=1 Tax=Ramlibacter paludis TaxID=2908000 RepID=UPI0023DAB775|nr:response regulator [Ramlibacter paludis]MCG2594374.1 response regulator [Ramlibacter paludis]
MPLLYLLPDRASAADPPAGAGDHPLFSAQRRNFTVLVVDDNASKRYAISRGLQAAGFLVVEAAHAADALATPACSAAVLDVYLPDMDGFALCERMRRAHPALPIVQVSSVLVEEPYRKAGRAAGADAYLTEPDLAELVGTLDALLQRPERKLQ